MPITIVMSIEAVALSKALFCLSPSLSLADEHKPIVVTTFAVFYLFLQRIKNRLAGANILY